MTLKDDYKGVYGCSKCVVGQPEIAVDRSLPKRYILRCSFES